MRSVEKCVHTLCQADVAAAAEERKLVDSAVLGACAPPRPYAVRQQDARSSFPPVNCAELDQHKPNCAPPTTYECRGGESETA